MRSKGRYSWKQWLLLIVAVLTIHTERSSPQAVRKDINKRKLEQQYSIDYYDDPKLQWMVRLNDERLLQGNSIVQSPLNENVLYITTNSGKLLALSAIDGKIITAIHPEAKTNDESGEKQTYEIFCYSGVAFGESSAGDQFLVYAIVDKPPADAMGGPETRVVAVSIPQHTIFWESVGLQGVGNGSPVVIANQKDSKNYVVLTHNIQDENSDETSQVYGQVTVLQTSNGHVIWTESELSRDEIPRGYGPPGSSKNPASGKYIGGMENNNDVVVWASSDDAGKGRLGSTFVFQLPTNFQDSNSDQVSALESHVLKKVRWNSITKPVFSANGTNMYIGVTGSELRGWLGDTRFDATANWATDLVPTSSNLWDPIPAAPTLSTDENRLFVASSSRDVVCLEAGTGIPLWHLTGTSTFLAEAKVTSDNRVYFIQSADGRIFSHDQHTGGLLWVMGCDQLDEDCTESVHGEFALSKSGQFLYYGSVNGRIIALKLGDLPTTLMPSSPSDGIDWTDSGDGKKSWFRLPDVGRAVLGAIGIILVLLLVFYITWIQIYKRNPHRHQEPQPPDTKLTDIDDYSLPSNPENAADPYEDSMISKHNKIHKPQKRNRTNRSDDLVENHNQADRLSIRLGTTNKISPIKEDFSFGASVVV